MSETTSSSSTMTSLMVETSVPKIMLGTTVKLNGFNYLLWAYAFRIFIGAQNKLAHLLQFSPADTDPTYVTWLTRDYSVMTWLLNNLDRKISGSVMFLPTDKDRDTLKVMYGNEKNTSRVFEIFECLFELKQENRSVSEFYSEVKGLIDELEMHQLSITYTVTLRGYRQDLAMSKFLSGLSPTLLSQVRGQILEGDSIPTLTVTFSRVMRISIGADVSSTPSIEQSAMVSGRGRGRGCDFGGQGRGFIGDGRGSYGGRQSASEKDLRQCKHCGRSNHIFEKCWEKFCRLKWAQLSESDSSAMHSTP